MIAPRQLNRSQAAAQSMVCRRMQKCDNQLPKRYCVEFTSSRIREVPSLRHLCQCAKTSAPTHTVRPSDRTGTLRNISLDQQQSWPNVNRIARTPEPRCTGTLTAASSPIGATMPRYRTEAAFTIEPPWWRTCFARKDWIDQDGRGRIRKIRYPGQRSQSGRNGY